MSAEAWCPTTSLTQKPKRQFANGSLTQVRKGPSYPQGLPTRRGQSQSRHPEQGQGGRRCHVPVTRGCTASLPSLVLFSPLLTIALSPDVQFGPFWCAAQKTKNK